VSRKDDKVSVDFDLEPYGIKHKFFYGKRWVMVGFEADLSAIAEWQAIKPGQSVSFEGVCNTAIIGTITPADSGVPHIVVFTSISRVIPIRADGK
jgi:hypothetical protein